MPQLKERSDKFCALHARDTDPTELWKFLSMSFAAGNPEVMLIAVCQGAVMVGHMIAFVTDWFGRKGVNVLQYEIDDGCQQDLDKIKGMFDAVCDWARAIGASEVRCVADSPQLARVYRMFYGFEGGDRILMRKEL
jgi:hypothetical protein